MKLGREIIGMGFRQEGNRKVGKQVENRKLGLRMYEKLHGKLLFYKLSYTYVYACTRECVCACVCVKTHKESIRGLTLQGGNTSSRNQRLPNGKSSVQSRTPSLQLLARCPRGPLKQCKLLTLFLDACQDVMMRPY